ncbi:nuclear speckle splicing regulatory protein 1-like [Bacillus rossius redtenbacheri]|uniref:nuclear speckle splicing regulatory protein 1-like n=1 Tax=Bacillus rossius redtenbacheri TaxID=93214 RepID=UPI002FDD32A1
MFVRAASLWPASLWAEQTRQESPAERRMDPADDEGPWWLVALLAGLAATCVLALGCLCCRRAAGKTSSPGSQSGGKATKAVDQAPSMLDSGRESAPDLQASRGPPEARRTASQDLCGSPSRYLHSSASEDLRESASEDLREPASKDLRESAPKVLQNVLIEPASKDLQESAPKDLRNELQESAPKDLHKEVLEPTPKDPQESAPKDLHKEVLESASKDLQESASKVLQNELLEPTSKDLQESAPKVLQNELQESAPKDLHKEVLEPTPKDPQESAPKDLHKEVLGSASKDLKESAPKDLRCEQPETAQEDPHESAAGDVQKPARQDPPPPQDSEELLQQASAATEGRPSATLLGDHSRAQLAQTREVASTSSVTCLSSAHSIEDFCRDQMARGSRLLHDGDLEGAMDHFACALGLYSCPEALYLRLQDVLSQEGMCDPCTQTQAALSVYLTYLAETLLNDDPETAENSTD